MKSTAYMLFGGEGGIRTRGGLLTHTRFPGVRLKPLIHLSVKTRILGTNSGLSQGGWKIFQSLLDLASCMAVATSPPTCSMPAGSTSVVLASAATRL